MSAISPASSPRLPSPPPIAEDQIGPTSPGVSLFEDHGKLPGNIHNSDNGASRRIRPGSKADEISEGPPLMPLQDIDSAFQLTEHLKALHWSNTHPAGSNAAVPISADVAKQLAQAPEGVEKSIYLYELARLLIQKTNAIIIALFADSPPCSAQTCPEMRASEWQYLCAVHDPPKPCSAIDYCCHTLDWAATQLTSSKLFPSRLGLAAGDLLGTQMKMITNIFRRVYRIFAHAWFQHREVFWRVEGKTGLYVLFKTVCDEYGMIQVENYTIPPEAEGIENTPVATEQPVVMRREERQASELWEPTDGQPLQPVGNTILATGDTTKRHRSTAGSSVSSVIHEEVEEEDEEEDVNEPSVVEHTALGLQHQDDAAQEPAPEVMTDAIGVARTFDGGPEPLLSSSENREAELMKAQQEEAERLEQERHAAEQEEQDEKERFGGLQRSDTVKAPQDVPTKEEERDDAASEDPESSETTGTGKVWDEHGAAVPATESIEPATGEVSEEAAAEVMELVTAPAADGDEATKTIAD